VGRPARRASQQRAASGSAPSAFNFSFSAFQFSPSNFTNNLGMHGVTMRRGAPVVMGARIIRLNGSLSVE